MRVGSGVRGQVRRVGEVGGRWLARRPRPRREGAGLAGSLALRHRLRATAQVAGRWRVSRGGQTPLFGEQGVASVRPPPTPMHWRVSLRTVPATMRNFWHVQVLGQTAAVGGWVVRRTPVFSGRSESWLWGEQRSYPGSYVPGLLPWAQKVLDPLPFTGMC